MTLTEKLEFVSYDDLAKLEFGRLFWKSAHGRTLLLAHWLHPNHPHRERFAEFRPIIERILSADPKDDEILDHELEKEGWSLRTALREIPPIIGSIPFGITDVLPEISEEELDQIKCAQRREQDEQWDGMSEEERNAMRKRLCHGDHEWEPLRVADPQ